MKARFVRFGIVEIDGQRYERDVMVVGGRVRRRHKKASRPLRGHYGHTPLSLAEPIPWTCQRLIVGTGADGQLPITPELVAEAERRGIELIALPTPEACRMLSRADPDAVVAILHVTC